MAKPNLLLLHGFCESKAMWNDFEKALSGVFNIHLFDLPGFGESQKDITGYSIKDMSDDVLKDVKKLKIDNYVLIGHSMGGYVALEMLKKTDNIKGIGLFHSTALPDTQERKMKREEVIQFIEKHGSAVFAKNFVPQLFYEQNKKKCEKDILKLTKIAMQCAENTLIASTKAMQQRADNTEILKTTPTPVMFIAGKHDGSIALSSVIQQVSLPKDAHIHILDDCAHMGMFEQKEKTLFSVKKFVEYCHR